MTELNWTALLGTARRLVTVGLTALITVVGVIWGAQLGFWNKDRELDLKMVDISLQMLNAEDTKSQPLEAKRFALRALRKYSDVELSDDQIEAWVQAGPTLLSPIPSSGTKADTFSSRGFGNIPPCEEAKRALESPLARMFTSYVSIECAQPLATPPPETK